MSRFSFVLRAVALMCGVTLLVPLAGTSAPGFSSLRPVPPDSALARTSAAHGFDLSWLDPSCPACKDFAQFADGGWLAHHEIPAKYALWGHVPEMRELNAKRLHALIEAVPRPGVAVTAAQRQVGDYYAACMDTNAIDRAGITPLAPELERTGNVRDAASLVTEVAHLHDLGVPALFRLGAESNPSGADKPEIIDWSQRGGFTLPDRSYYLDAAKAKIRDAYVAHVTKMFSLAGEDAERSATDAAAVLKLETALAGVARSPAELRDPVANTNVMSVDAAAALVPAFDLHRYLSARAIPGGELDAGQPPYLKGLNTVLAATPPADFAPYLRWRLLNAYATALSTPFVDESTHFFAGVLTGATEAPPRWERCVSATNAALGESVGTLYNAKYFTPLARGRAILMIDSVKSELRNDLGTLSWMSEATRRQALVKLDAMRSKIGYPAHPRDYSPIVVRRDAYLSDRMNAAAFEVHRRLAGLGKPYDRSDWGSNSPTVNASYNGSANDITFYAGILQPPYFSDAYDDAINYGAIGSVMGHEMTHAFDDAGRHFEENGALRDWWTPQDAQNYEARATCVERQFDAFVVADGVHANGKVELGEAIADLGGITVAFRAFEKTAEAKAGRGIDGFTPNQRFFLGFAMQHTEKDRPDYAKMRASSEPHPLGPFRINGSLSNMPEFAQAFFVAPPTRWSVPPHSAARSGKYALSLP